MAVFFLVGFSHMWLNPLIPFNVFGVRAVALTKTLKVINGSGGGVGIHCLRFAPNECTPVLGAD